MQDTATDEMADVIDGDFPPISPEDTVAPLDFSEAKYAEPIPLDEKIFQPLGLVIEIDKLDFDEWARIGLNLDRMNHAHQWWIGDWMNGGDDVWGESTAQVLDAFGASTIPNYARVARTIPLGSRRADLTWTHHKEACGLETGGLRAIKKALRLAADNDWSTRELADYVKACNKPDDDEGNGDKEAGEANSVTFTIGFRVAPADRDVAQSVAEAVHGELLAALAESGILVVGDLGVKANVNESSE